ncbi:MAG: class I SAM-dependent methyltransferase [Betaproteobacteria bacterium]|nr:class I SAM-dependent methyltransferase [Betaproteobacteria bacterium]
MHGTEAPSPWIARWAHLIAPASPVLDLACGAGRHMRHLAKLGHPVLGVDRSEEALATASAWGTVLQADIEHAAWPLAGQTFGAVVVTNYLWRALWPQILAAVQPDGVLLYETYAQGHETVGRPSREDFLLRPGELLAVAAQGGLRVLAYEDGFLPKPERFVQRLVAVREAPRAAPARWPLV